MALQYSVDVRDAGLNARFAKIGPYAVVRVWSGPKPKNCAAPDSGELLASINLPRSWMAPAADGRIRKSGEWKDISAALTGKPGHFRIYSAGGQCHLQGEIGEEMALSSALLFAGQMFTVTAFAIKDPNE